MGEIDLLPAWGVQLGGSQPVLSQCGIKEAMRAFLRAPSKSSDERNDKIVPLIQCRRVSFTTPLAPPARGSTKSLQPVHVMAEPERPLAITACVADEDEFRYMQRYVSALAAFAELQSEPGLARSG